MYTTPHIYGESDAEVNLCFMQADVVSSFMQDDVVRVRFRASGNTVWCH